MQQQASLFVLHLVTLHRHEKMGLYHVPLIFMNGDTEFQGGLPMVGTGP